MKTKFLRILALLIVLGLSMFSFVACGKCQHSSTSDWIVDCDATCLTEGFQHKECSDCGSIIQVTSIQKTMCKYIDATCEYCQEEYYSKGLHFMLDSDGESYSVVGIGTASDKDIVIPSIFKGKPVKSIAQGAFDYIVTNEQRSMWDKISSVKIPSSIKSIGKYAFYVRKNSNTPLVIYYEGSSFWSINIDANGQGSLSNATIYTYSSSPKYSSWHYVDGIPALWDMS